MILTTALAVTLTGALTGWLLPSTGHVAPQDGEPLREVATAVDATPKAHLSVYDISDLTGARELDELRAAVTQDDLAQSVRVAAFEKYMSLMEKGAAKGAAKSIVEAIEIFIDPPAGADFRVASTEPGELTVVATGQQHEWVQQYLEASRKFNGLIDIETKLYKLPHGHLDQLVDGRSGSVLDQPALQKLLRLIEGLDGVELVTAPRVVVHAGARANLSVLEQTAYIKDYELTLLPDLGQELADPVIDVLQTGVVLDIRAVPIDDRLAVKAAFSYSTAEKPIRSQELRLGAGGQVVTIQLPEVRSTKASARFDLADAATIAIATVDPGGGDDDADGGHDILLLIKATRLEAE